MTNLVAVWLWSFMVKYKLESIVRAVLPKRSYLPSICLCIGDLKYLFVNRRFVKVQNLYKSPDAGTGQTGQAAVWPGFPNP